ncbi:unnamed protein product [Parnassius apollo]|uniref:WW domain binding protein VOPP1 n=1 Tax=Parnassius apollo TaxID=110799 RepID=A0A8S3Y8W5_PARAO|nr:unnamed protein product [Parnassius apollo]
MVFAFLIVSLLGPIIFGQPACASEIPCEDGRLCPAHWLCCEHGCCAPASATPRHEPDDDAFKEILSYPWYTQWSVFIILGCGSLLSILGVCCAWCLPLRRPHGSYMCSLSCCIQRPNSEHDSAGSVYPPPRYSRCGSFHQAPPPYSEVTSKPDLYPLVITCAEGDRKNGTGGNYLMVHYFRNYVIRPPGSLSATSTAESLNSSFICNAANEANSIIPPPYSCASNYEECGAGCGAGCAGCAGYARAEVRSTTRREPSANFRENLIASPVEPLDAAFDLELELIDYEMYCDGGCKPRLGTSPTAHRSHSNVNHKVYDHEAYGPHNLFSSPSEENAGACESPPQPTSPTQTSKESTLHIPSDERSERRSRRLENVRKTLKARKSSLYMPLSIAHSGRQSRISPGSRISSRSAPATPCGALVPNILIFTQRVSTSRYSSRSSRLEEENDPLLTDANSIIPPPYSCASNYEECGAGCGAGCAGCAGCARAEVRSTTRRELSAAFRKNLIASPVEPLANSIIPPPYSCASNYEECGAGCGAGCAGCAGCARAEVRSTTRRELSAAFRKNLIASPVEPLQDAAFDLGLELIDYEMYCDGGCKPQLGVSPTAHRSHSNFHDTVYHHKAYGPHNLLSSPLEENAGACESPPQPTSPTQTSKEYTLHRLSDERSERRSRRLENVRRTLKARKSSLYMPLSIAHSGRQSRISPGSRISSRSAPATPCGALVPNILIFTQRVSTSRYSSRSSRFEEENDPLLTDVENPPLFDHKF